MSCQDCHESPCICEAEKKFQELEEEIIKESE